MSNDYSYGATVGVQDPFSTFTPYSEISYNHQNTSKKLLTSDQFDYGTGVKLNYFSRLSPFLEANDFLDSKWIADFPWSVISLFRLNFTAADAV